MTGLAAKKVALMDSLKALKRVTVAFSGGIDSTLVLKMALETLGRDNVTAVVANSELFTDEEFDKAVSLAEELGATVQTTTLDYLSETHIEHNTPDSWYYAKKMFYDRLTEMAAANGSAAVLDGLIKNDEQDYRPGMKARTEVGARSLLQEADFYKVDVRALSQELGLTNWNKVASCSVASRFPYGTTLTHENVAQVMAAESYLRGLGFPTVRVRFHEDIARIELPEARIGDFLVFNDRVNRQLQSLGFRYVTLDLGGFRSGRMNDTLTKQQLATFA
ncbi:ATP-dependent sacrificial sulfur transferase LarE [Lactiplantibacillus sp. WILCCON 0030]|uniref:ATP-dependent sacrificial sulfur transferase LarE n=1 Tax=Lactiplantibacillus brownii TaxID=3069269 RepID=A0ABU1A8F7_9LACO|nr:ATP-dependent sacrificial sulfur transferase LarE [Lactiplantibacillus brownii]MDQ7936727.1 ATP-dependent sacrificial sulfur transferase LarE [Lactiplantibacillus brownii]